MRKLASEIIYDLETRIEKLEKQAVFGWIKDQYEGHKRNKRLMEEERLRFESLSPQEQQKELNRKKKMEKEKARKEKEKLDRIHAKKIKEDAIETTTESFKEFMDTLQYGIFEWAEETNYRLDSKGNIKGSFDFGGFNYKISSNFDEKLLRISENWERFDRGNNLGYADVQIKIKGFSFEKTYPLHITYRVNQISEDNVHGWISRRDFMSAKELAGRICRDLEKALGDSVKETARTAGFGRRYDDDEWVFFAHSEHRDLEKKFYREAEKLREDFEVCVDNLCDDNDLSICYDDGVSKVAFKAFASLADYGTGLWDHDHPEAETLENLVKRDRKCIKLAEEIENLPYDLGLA